MGNILDWIVEKATKYEPLVKTGVAALSTYASLQRSTEEKSDATSSL